MVLFQKHSIKCWLCIPREWCQGTFALEHLFYRQLPIQSAIAWVDDMTTCPGPQRKKAIYKLRTWASSREGTKPVGTVPTDQKSGDFKIWLKNNMLRRHSEGAPRTGRLSWLHSFSNAWLPKQRSWAKKHINDNILYKKLFLGEPPGTFTNQH